MISVLVRARLTNRFVDIDILDLSVFWGITSSFFLHIVKNVLAIWALFDSVVPFSRMFIMELKLLTGFGMF